jgi:hypothetical protein
MFSSQPSARIDSRGGANQHGLIIVNTLNHQKTKKLLGRYFRIVVVEACSPSLASSSRMRGLSHVGLTAHMRRMNRINSRCFPGRPRLRRDFHRQNILKPARCQPMTVSGRKIINGVSQFGQALLSIIQRPRSHGRSFGLFPRRLSTGIWCHRARTSMASSC